jgi:hypothetical protein
MFELIEKTNMIERNEEEVARRAEKKKKARLRKRGPYRKVWRSLR